MITEEKIKRLLEIVEAMLRDPSAQIHMSRGIVRYPNYSTGSMEAKPSEGKTLTIETGGGAKDETLG